MLRNSKNEANFIALSLEYNNFNILENVLDNELYLILRVWI